MKNELERSRRTNIRPEGSPKEDVGINRRLIFRECRHFHAQKDPAGAKVKGKYDKVLNVSLRYQ